MIQMFADNTKIFWEIKDAHDRDQLQHDLKLKALEDWSNEWLLKFNADKCKVMHLALGKSQGEFKYTMTKDDHPIELEKPVIDIQRTLNNRSTKQIACLVLSDGHTPT